MASSTFRSKRIALGFVPLIVIGLAFGIYLDSALSSTPSGVVYPGYPLVSNSSCNTYFNYDSSNPISVLVIHSGSTGKICVEYANSFNNTISLPSYIAVYEYNSSGAYGVCSTCSFNEVTPYFQLAASPTSVNFTPGVIPINETVTYSISVPSNVTNGIYGVFLLQFCSLFPMVVVPNNASFVQLSSSDFSSWYPHNGSCPEQVLSAQLLGVGGFSVVSLY